jgi:hypothetical protein
VRADLGVAARDAVDPARQRQGEVGHVELVRVAGQALELPGLDQVAQDAGDLLVGEAVVARLHRACGW